MKYLDELPVPAGVGLAIASLRALMDWKKGVTFWHNLRNVLLLYAVSLGVSYLSFMAMETPTVALTRRDTVMAAVITFFGINIVNSLKALGEDLEKNPLQFVINLLAVWRTGKAASEAQAKDDK